MLQRKSEDQSSLHLSSHLFVPGVRCQGQVLFPVRQTYRRKLLQFSGNPRRSLPGHVHHLHPASARCFWRFVPPFAVVLAYPVRVWCVAACVGVDPRSFAACVN